MPDAVAGQSAEPAGVRCGERFSSYEELYGRALRAARGLHELGVGADDRVALLLRNSIEYVEASIAPAPLGAAKVPINWHWRGEEVAYVLRDSRAKALVVHDDLWPAIRASVPDGVRVIVVPAGESAAEAGGAEAGARAGVEADARAAVEAGAEADAEPPGDALWWPRWLSRLEPWREAPDGLPPSIIYTSGTTGRPKGVVRAPTTEAKREALRALFDEVFKLGPQERTLIPAPMYHSAPNAYVGAAVLHGMHMTLMRGFDAEEFLRLVERDRITVVQMVPTMFVRLLSLPERVRSRYDVSSLRWIVHAAAPCPPQVKRAMIDWLGPIVAEYYGSTEVGLITFAASEEWLAHPGTVGRTLPHATLKVLGADGRELPPGQSGEVHMRLDVLSDFTYEGDEAKRRAVERDGLVSCGDVGYLDEDGYLYLDGRTSDMVISGGVNVYPAEIEACLLSLPGVRDCAVFGVPDDELGEVLAAHVQLHEGASVSAADVRAHVHARLAGYKTPRVVEFTDSLPREDSGKIFKRRLREPYWRGRERAI